MRKPTLLITFGIVAALLPFAGIPGSWKTALFVVIGVTVAVVGFMLRRDETAGQQHDTFVENGVSMAS